MGVGRALRRVVMTILILAVFVAIPVIVVGLILLFTFGQRLKGGLTLSLGNSHFSPGQDIAGVATVTAKKPMGPGRLFVSLVCTEEWYEWETDADGDRSRRKKTREVYREDVNLDSSLTMQQNGTHTAPFVLRTPQPQDTVVPDEDLPGWAKALKAVGASLQPDVEVHWTVTGRYDIKGLDLTADQRIPLNYELR